MKMTTRIQPRELLKWGRNKPKKKEPVGGSPGERDRGETWDLRRIKWPKPSLFSGSIALGKIKTDSQAS